MRSIHSRQTGGYIRGMKNLDDGATAVMEPPVFLTTSEVSRILGVSPNTVTRWARDGRLACQVTLGGHHRFERAVIEELRQTLNRGANPGRR
jgi:excisionase family DNA binding protein